MKTKKLLAVVLAVMMLICAMPLAVSAEDTAPATTIINDATYYQIGTADELVWFAEQVNAGQKDINAILTADIDLTDVAWTPIGSYTTAEIVFSGIFDGANFTVKGLKCSGSVIYLGLFGYVKDGGIKNLTVSGEVAVYNKGGLIAGQISDSILYNCKAVGKVSRVGSGYYCYAGGVVGVATHSVIINCVAQTDIKVDFATTAIHYAAVGGIAGVANAGNEVPQCILNSYCVGNITVGGVTYGPQSSTSIPHFYVGGIAGYLADDAVNNYYHGEIVDKEPENSRKEIGYAFGYVDPEFDAKDETDTSNMTIVKNNYYPAGKKAIGAKAADKYDESGWATGIAADSDLVALLNANIEEVALIITTHRSFLAESTWADIVERVDGDSVAVSEWKKGSNGLPVLAIEFGEVEEPEEDTTVEDTTDAENPDDGDEDEDNSCNHMCHKKGLKGFIWKLVRFFQKSFKRNQYCECGVAHY